MQKIIYRLCACSRNKTDRQSMFRVVKTPNHEIHIDLTYQLQGRGAYLSKDKSVIENAKKRRSLEKSLKVNDCQNVYGQLIELLK